MMNWYPTLVFYFGLIDAGLIMLGGIILAVLILLDLNWEKVYERVGPAVFTLIGSNIAAAIVLGATRWLIG